MRGYSESLRQLTGNVAQDWGFASAQQQPKTGETTDDAEKEEETAAPKAPDGEEITTTDHMNAHMLGSALSSLDNNPAFKAAMAAAAAAEEEEDSDGGRGIGADAQGEDEVSAAAANLVSRHIVNDLVDSSVLSMARSAKLAAERDE